MGTRVCLLIRGGDSGRRNNSGWGQGYVYQFVVGTGVGVLIRVGTAVGGIIRDGDRARCIHSGWAQG